MALSGRQVAAKTLQMTLTVGALAWLLGQLDIRAALQQFSQLEAYLVAWVLGLTVVEFATRFGSWYVLVNGYRPTALGDIARTDLVIKFINHVVPSKVSGHSIAPVVLRHFTGIGWPAAVGIAGANTGLYALLYGLASTLAVVMLAPVLSAELLLVLAGSTALYVVVAILVLATGHGTTVVPAVLDRARQLVCRLPVVGPRIADRLDQDSSFTADSQAVFRSLTTRPSVVGPYAVCWLSTIALLPGLRVLALFAGIGVDVAAPWTVFFALVLAYSVTILPLTPGGVGITELSASLVFIGLGIPEAAAVTVVLLDRSLGVYLPALLGWLPATRTDITAFDTGE